MSTKHFVNDPNELVTLALHSLTLTNPRVAVDAKNKIVYRRPDSHHDQQVAILSGGGSGHEPSFAGMVGPGMLSASVAGTIFASPSIEQIRAGITSSVDSSRGVLVTVMNYTGDVLNFGVAVEKARAAGRQVEMVVVGDDVGVGRQRAGKVGRRGIAGTVLVHKISGALAARGHSLEHVARVARLTAENLVSVGASLEHVHVPGREVASNRGTSAEERLARNEVEIGMGIHNEPGSGRENLGSLSKLVATMLAQLLDQEDTDRAFLNVNSNEVVLLVNNLGGVSPLELGAITAEVVNQLAAQPWSIRPVRILSGTYMTSLNGIGFSITLLNVVNTDIGGPSMVDLLDDPCEVIGWSAPIKKATWETKNTATRAEEVIDLKEEVQTSGLTMEPKSATSALAHALNRVVAAEPQVTKFDTVVGDGDCGIGLKRGAEAILKRLSEKPLIGDVVLDLADIITIVENEMDGTSGALYAIFLNALLRALQRLAPGEATPQLWAEALQHSCDALAKYTPARPGDRTVIDALYPFVEVLGSTGDLVMAANAARKAAENTRGMKASLGRSVYVGGSGYEDVPDPGAYGLACFFLGLGYFKPAEEGWETI